MELDVLPNALTVPVTLMGMDTSHRDGFSHWLLAEFDVDSQDACTALPEHLLGLLVATAQGWTGRVWDGASLVQKQQLLDRLCAHGTLGDLRGEVGDWWWFALGTTEFRLEAGEFYGPEDRVQTRIAQQLLTDAGLLSEPGLTQLQKLAEQHQLALPACLMAAAQTWDQPLWLMGQVVWANPKAQALAWTPPFSEGSFTAQTPMGWANFQGLTLGRVGVIRPRPALRLRDQTSTVLRDLLPTAVRLDWITSDFRGVLKDLLPHLGRLQARVVLCLEQPGQLEVFFTEFCTDLEQPSFDTNALAWARAEGHLQLRLGVGLSQSYQIALLGDDSGDGLYYYAAQDQPVRILGSWEEGELETYRQNFETLWQTTADNRVQVIDLTDLLEKYGY
ncbi:hypothetical protein [Candidatus Cyanaurora vandensis]|uniref:hypothetical protein n=1 Tax=Candidatus Cyanaurora vandensis TaxID=2714958 RepID=UPI00257F88C9|nr:hypothetical protein [Candidatus Cyanaurora vandensis]